MSNKITYCFQPNEEKRLAALYRYNILDTEAEVEFDNIAYLAKQICQTPIAVISLMDKDRQWFKAKIGTDIKEIPCNVSFCTYTLLAKDNFLQSCDTSIDERFSKNPLVIGPPFIRFYAGVPLITPDQQKIGALCVIGHSPYQLDNNQIQALHKLSQQVVAQLELKLHVKELEASESRTKAIINNMLFGLVITDKEGIIESVNPAAEKTFQYKEQELIGKSLSLLLPELSDSTRINFLRAKQTQNRHSRLQWLGINKIGNKIPLELSVYEFSTSQGQRFANNIKEVLDRQELEKLKIGFISSINHELRTPLTSINGALNLLASGILGELPTEAQEMVELAERNNVRLISLLNDILDLQRLESSHSEMAFQICSLKTIITSASKEISSLAQEKNISLNITYSEANIFADYKHLVQAIVNLLKNAIKFSPENTTIDLVVEELDEWVTLKVIDQGCGISPNLLPNLFEHFHQGEFSDNRQQNGTGIGLAICKAIVEQHNGILGVDSTIGQGSTFWLRLPKISFSSKNDIESHNTLSLLANSNSKPSFLEKAISNNPEILLVDDDAELLEILSVDLSKYGISVITSTSGQDAIHSARAKLPKLIVLDINIPNGNGFEVVENLRSEPKLQNTSLIIYSGRELTGEQQTKLKLGTTRFLTKTRVSCADFRNNILELLNANPI